MSVPFGSWCASGAHSSVGFGWELESDGVGRAGHRLCLLGVGFQTNTFKGHNETVNLLLQEAGVPRRYVHIIHVKDRKKGLHLTNSAHDTGVVSEHKKENCTKELEVQFSSSNSLDETKM